MFNRRPLLAPRIRSTTSLEVQQRETAAAAAQQPWASSVQSQGGPRDSRRVAEPASSSALGAAFLPDPPRRVTSRLHRGGPRLHGSQPCASAMHPQLSLGGQSRPSIVTVVRRPLTSDASRVPSVVPRLLVSGVMPSILQRANPAGACAAPDMISNRLEGRSSIRTLVHSAIHRANTARPAAPKSRIIASSAARPVPSARRHRPQAPSAAAHAPSCVERQAAQGAKRSRSALSPRPSSALTPVTSVQALQAWQRHETASTFEGGVTVLHRTDTPVLAVAVGRCCDGPAPSTTVSVPAAFCPGLSAATRAHLAEAYHVRRATVLPTKSTSGFTSDRDRALKWATDASQCLWQVMPQEAVFGLLGGRDSFAQLRPEDRGALAAAALIERAGSDGSALTAIVKTQAFIDGYADARRALEPGFRPWPMSQGLAALLILGEHTRATEGGRGSRAGATVGHNFRTTLKRMRTVGYPIADLDCKLVDAAAPQAKAGGGRRTVAATLPPKLLGHMEFLARCTVDEIVALFAAIKKPRARAGCFLLRLYARSPSSPG